MTGEIERRKKNYWPSIFGPLEEDFWTNPWKAMDKYMSEFMRSTPIAEYAREKEYVYEADIPGITNKDKIKLKSLKGGLELIAEEDKGKEGKTRYYHQVWSIPEDADTTKISSAYRDGVLYITVPRHEAKEIKVN